MYVCSRHNLPANDRLWKINKRITTEPILLPTNYMYNVHRVVVGLVLLIYKSGIIYDLIEKLHLLLQAGIFSIIHNCVWLDFNLLYLGFDNRLTSQIEQKLLFRPFLLIPHWSNLNSQCLIIKPITCFSYVLMISLDHQNKMTNYLINPPFCSDDFIRSYKIIRSQKSR